MRLALAVFALLGAVTPVFASETLPAGVVACLSYKAAQQYADYSKSAPKFAEDLLARAVCYRNKEAVEVVKLGGNKGYAQLKLLSGHKIWVPAQALSAPKTGTPEAR